MNVIDRHVKMRADTWPFKLGTHLGCILITAAAVFLWHDQVPTYVFVLGYWLLYRMFDVRERFIELYQILYDDDLSDEELERALDSAHGDDDADPPRA